jgi:site-specific recombinase XerD
MTLYTPSRLRDALDAHLASSSPSTREIYQRVVARLQAWGEAQMLSPAAMQSSDLERFLGEEAASYSHASIQQHRSALRTFYDALMKRGIVHENPAHNLHLARGGHIASRGPVALLTDEALAHVREQAQVLGAVQSLAVCLLDETPISVAGVARLSTIDLAQDPRGRTFVILGRNPASKTPWRISEQAYEAVESLQGAHQRLISPQTKNPNLLMVRRAVEQTRVRANIQTPDLVAALKDTHHRRERERCNQLRLEPSRFLAYQRRLLRGLTPLHLGPN